MAKVLEIAKNSSTFWLFIIYIYVSINGCWLITTNCESVILRTWVSDVSRIKILSIENQPHVTMSHESANQNNSSSVMTVHLQGSDSELTKLISIFLLGGKQNFRWVLLFLTPRDLCITVYFILSWISMLRHMKLG